VRPRGTVRRKLGYFALACLASVSLAAAAAGQAPKRAVRIYLDLRETNLEKPSTVATRTLGERLAAAGFRVTTNRREAALVVEGTINARPAPVTDDVKQQGGLNAEASASVQLLAGADVIATGVVRSSPGDWGVQAERVGEDRLIEVAGRLADELFAGQFVNEVAGAQAVPALSAETPPGARAKIRSRPAPSPKPVAKPGVSFLEVVALVRDYAPEDRIVAALRKYGIKFQPREAALKQLRDLGASEVLIGAVKTATVVT